MVARPLQLPGHISYMLSLDKQTWGVREKKTRSLISSFSSVDWSILHWVTNSYLHFKPTGTSFLTKLCIPILKTFVSRQFWYQQMWLTGNRSQQHMCIKPIRATMSSEVHLSSNHSALSHHPCFIMVVCKTPKPQYRSWTFSLYILNILIIVLDLRLANLWHEHDFWNSLVWNWLNT